MLLKPTLEAIDPRDMPCGLLACEGCVHVSCENAAAPYRLILACLLATVTELLSPFLLRGAARARVRFRDDFRLVPGIFL